MKKEIQSFLGYELRYHAETKGFAFLLEQETLINKIKEKFGLSHSEALRQIIIFIQEMP